MRTALLALPIVLALAAGGLAAQDLPQAVPGTRVRVTPTGYEAARLVGTIARATRDTLWLASRAGADAVRVPRITVRRLEVSLGRRSHVVRGAIIGAIVGGAATGLFLAGFCSDPDTLCEADEVAKAALIIGLPPVAVGTVIGLLASHEHWAAAGWPATARWGLGVRVALAPLSSMR